MSSMVYINLMEDRFSLSFTAQTEGSATDSAGSRHEADPGIYARALERVYERNLTPANMTSSLGHPPLYDRMISAGVEPDYPRPLRPPRARLLLALGIEAIVAAVVLVLMATLHGFA